MKMTPTEQEWNGITIARERLRTCEKIEADAKEALKAARAETEDAQFQLNQLIDESIAEHPLFDETTGEVRPLGS